MGSAVEVSTALPSSERARQPAFGAHVDYPELERRESDSEECAADRFARRIQWPALAFLAVAETAWLLALGYLAVLLFG
jgi:hypothetical protein